MAKRFISFGSIDQFRTIVKNVKWQSQYTGEKDAEGNPIMNRNAKAPIVKAIGTEKIHGTNAAWVYTKDEQWCQSRKNIITPEKDNAGCAFMMEQRKNEFNLICEKLIEYYNIDVSKKGLALYMEFCGGNIQKNSCVSGLDKMFIIFKHAKVFELDNESEESNTWIDTKVIF